MTDIVSQTVEVLDGYEGRDAAITFTLYFCCFLSGFYPRKSKLHRSLQRVFERLEDCRVVLRLYDDLTILRDMFSYELRPGVSTSCYCWTVELNVVLRNEIGLYGYWNVCIISPGWVTIRPSTSAGWEKWKCSTWTRNYGISMRISSGPAPYSPRRSGTKFLFLFSEENRPMFQACLRCHAIRGSTELQYWEKGRRVSQSDASDPCHWTSLIVF